MIAYFLRPSPVEAPAATRFSDAIVRQPLNSDEVEVPVGIVSKQYTLVQHMKLLDEVVKAIKNAGIKPDEVKVELDLTVYGERMRLGLLFPGRYNLKLGNEDEMELRLLPFAEKLPQLSFPFIRLGWYHHLLFGSQVIEAGCNQDRKAYRTSETEKRSHAAQCLSR